MFWGTGVNSGWRSSPAACFETLQCRDSNQWTGWEGKLQLLRCWQYSENTILAPVLVVKKDKQQRLVFRWLHQSFDLVLWHILRWGSGLVSDALQACRSHPCPNASSVKSQLEKVCVTGKRGWDWGWQYYYQQETGCSQDKRYLVILAVTYLLLACNGWQLRKIQTVFNWASPFKPVLNHIRGCNTSMVVGEQCAIVDILLDKTQNQNLNHRILNHLFWHE